MKNTVLLFFVLYTPFFTFAQSLGERLSQYQDQYPLEKVYISHDRPYYAPGDTIWCQAYLVEGRSHLTFEKSSVVHVEWYNAQGERLRSFLLKMENGRAAFEIPTSIKDSSGVYQLRAFTQYQCNFDVAYQFQRSILVSTQGPSLKQEKTTKDFSIQFFPEGGYLVNGCLGKVAFLATDQKGNPVPFSGILRKKDGTTLQAIEALHEGMGAFSFTPQPNEKYEVVSFYHGQEKIFTLPAPLSSGYQLLVDNHRSEYLKFSISPSTGKSLIGLQVVGHLRGQVFLDEVIQRESPYGKRINRSDLPSGLIHLTVFDQKDRPIAERLLFNRNPKEEIEVNIDKNDKPFATRSKIEIDLQTLQTQIPVETQLSISVYNSDLIQTQKKGLNIQNYLWLQSDLPHSIPNAHQYLQEDNAQSRLFLDYLLLTRGWRRFNWQKVLTSTPQINYLPQLHLSIAGKVTKGNKKEPVKAEVFLNILDAENFTFLNLTTREDGLFYFKGFDFSDSTELVLQANEFSARKQNRRKKNEVKRLGNKNVNIQLLDLTEFPFELIERDIPQLAPQQNTQQEAYANTVENIQTAKAAYRNLLTEEIAEMEITGKQLTKYQIQQNDLEEDYRKLGMTKHPQARNVFLDNLPNKGQIYPDVYELIGAYFPATLIDRRESFNKKVFLPNRGNFGIQTSMIPALMVIDGMIIDQSTDSSIPPIQPLDVKSISLLSGTQAFNMFGGRARGGVIFIITRQERVALGDQSTSEINGTLNYTHPGYYSARTFYSPRYPVPKAVAARPDLRTTLYWNPSVQTGERSNTLSFFTGDLTGTFTIQIEGISAGGLPFVHWEEIVVE